jgi:hypothetical protein
VRSYDNQVEAAFRSLRHLLTLDADAVTDLHHSLWCDRVEGLRECEAASRLRRASGKTGESSKSEGERSNIEGDGGKSDGSAAA